MNFDQALSWVLEKEGGYANHPADPGGETNYGITQRTARAHGYKGSMRAIPMDVVRSIYRKGFWDSCRLDEMPDHPLRLVVFDGAVHSGPAQSLRWLQAELGVTQTGLTNNKTLDALRLVLGLDRLALAVVQRRLDFLQGLRTWRTFKTGWSKRIADLRHEIAG